MNQPKVLAHVRFDVYQMDNGTFVYEAQTWNDSGDWKQEYKTGTVDDLFQVMGDVFVDQCVFEEEK